MIACNVSEGSCESRLCRYQASFTARVPLQSRQEVGSPSACNAARVMKQQWGGKSMYKGVTPVKDLGAYEWKDGEKT